MLPKFARFTYRKRWFVLIVWIILLVGVNAWSKHVGDAFSTDFKLPNSDSQQAYQILKDRFPARSGATGTMVFKSDQPVTSPEVKKDVNDIIGEIAKVPHVIAVITPYSQEGAAQVSPNDHIAQVAIVFDLKEQDIASNKDTVNKIEDIVANANKQGVQFELSGQIFASEPAVGSEGIGLIAAVVILLIAFGSVLAMGLPIITALFGIGIGLAVVTLLSHVLSLPDFTSQLASMIGIGVGIDYALFIVTRYRQGLQENLSPEEATVTAINTAGRSVIFAGITVVISLLGMVLMNINFIQGLGIGAATVVAITMLASITLLPAILGFVGTNIDRFKIPGIRQATHKNQKGIWYKWSQYLEKHALPVFLAGLALILALAIPVLSIRLGSSDASALPTSDTTRRAYDLQAEGFGVGSNGPLLLVAEINGKQDLGALQKVQIAAKQDSNVAYVTQPIPNQDFSAATIQVIPKTSPQDEATVDLIHRLRTDVIPTATQNTDITVHVGGLTATFDDIATVLSDRLPIFIGVVLALSFILLMVVFRSLVIPLKAVILNMLSIAAAYGVLVAIFQWGWLSNVFGISTRGPIESFLPMMLFAILFGLSMDYEVFLLSRIKEEYDRTKNNSGAIAYGLNSTARVITAAAAIMITVFASFALGDLRIIKEFGIGLAVAVLIDASIARLVLVPSSMELFGKANWWLPKWLQWLPKVHIDGNEVAISEPTKRK